MLKHFLAAVAIVVLAAPVIPSQDEPETKPDTSKKSESLLKVPKGVGGPKVEGLELPADIVVTTKQRVVIIQAVTKGKVVKWIVFNQRDDTPVSYLEVPADKSLLVFPNDLEDVIVILAYTSINDVPTDPARTIVKVRPPPKTASSAAADKDKDKELPKEQPKVALLPKGTRVHVTMIFDHSKRSPAMAALENSAALRSVLKEGGHRLHILDVKQRAIDDADLRAYVNKHGPFCLIIQTERGQVVHAGRLPETDKEVAAQLAQVLGGK